MERDRRIAAANGLAPRGAGDVDVRAETGAEEPYPRLRGEIAAAAPARMVGMSVGDDGPFDRPPGIDVEVAGRTVESVGCDLQDVGGEAVCLLVHHPSPSASRIGA